MLYNVFKENNRKYYFEIKFLGNISSIVNAESAGLLPGATMKSNHFLNFKTVFTMHLPKELTKSERKKPFEVASPIILFLIDVTIKVVQNFTSYTIRNSMMD